MYSDEALNLNRRAFIEKAARLGAGIVAGAALISAKSGAGDEKVKPIAVVTISERKELAAVGGYILVKGTSKGDLLIIRSSESGFTVLSNICPHKECKVKVKSADLIQCPCHRSAYGIDGSYRHGPAKKDLTRFRHTVTDGLLSVYDTQ